MREILFRGKCKIGGEWVFGVPIQEYDGDWQICSSAYKYTVNPQTIGQYTGLTDKNGVKIFEGDIVRRICLNENYDYVVEYNELLAEFELMFIKDGGALAMFHAQEGEVIGNIYDNPELLKGGDGK